jgi:hypothetical protein
MQEPPPAYATAEAQAHHHHHDAYVVDTSAVVIGGELDLSMIPDIDGPREEYYADHDMNPRPEPLFTWSGIAIAIIAIIISLLLGGLAPRPTGTTVGSQMLFR